MSRRAAELFRAVLERLAYIPCSVFSSVNVQLFLFLLSHLLSFFINFLVVSGPSSSPSRSLCPSATKTGVCSQEAKK